MSPENINVCLIRLYLILIMLYQFIRHNTLHVMLQLPVLVFIKYGVNCEQLVYTLKIVKKPQLTENLVSLLHRTVCSMSTGFQFSVVSNIANVHGVPLLNIRPVANASLVPLSYRPHRQCLKHSAIKYKIRRKYFLHRSRH